MVTDSCAAADVDQPGRADQPLEVALRGAGRGSASRRAAGRALAHAAPEQRQRPPAAAVVPDAGRHQAAGPGHPGHLGQAADRVVHEVHDELGLGDRRRPRRRRAAPRPCPGGRRPPAAAPARPRRSPEWGRWRRPGRRRSRPTSPAVSTPGPQPTSSTRWPPAPSTRSANRGGERLGEPTHEPGVGVGVAEGHAATLTPVASLPRSSSSAAARRGQLAVDELVEVGVGAPQRLGLRRLGACGRAGRPSARPGRRPRPARPPGSGGRRLVDAR